MKFKIKYIIFSFNLLIATSTISFSQEKRVESNYTKAKRIKSSFRNLARSARKYKLNSIGDKLDSITQELEAEIQAEKKKRDSAYEEHQKKDQAEPSDQES